MGYITSNKLVMRAVAKLIFVKSSANPAPASLLQVSGGGHPFCWTMKGLQSGLRHSLGVMAAPTPWLTSPSRLPGHQPPSFIDLGSDPKGQVQAVIIILVEDTMIYTLTQVTDENDCS